MLTTESAPATEFRLPVSKIRNLSRRILLGCREGQHQIVHDRLDVEQAGTFSVVYAGVATVHVAVDGVVKVDTSEGEEGPPLVDPWACVARAYSLVRIGRAAEALRVELQARRDNDARLAT